MRKIINFNDSWRFSKSDKPVTSFPADWEEVTLPHTWNAVDGQDGGNDYYRGTCAYAKRFSGAEYMGKGRVFLEFRGVAMTAEVFLNGERLAGHEGGYSLFRVDLTDKLKEENILCVLADNGINDHVYPQKADFTFYGGIYRDVNLICVPEQHFELLKDGTPGIRVTPVMSESRAVVTLESWQNTGGKVHFSILAPDGCGGTELVAEADAQSRNGYAREEFVVDAPRLWDGLDDPYLYLARAELLPAGESEAAGGTIEGMPVDRMEARFGCRSFSFDKENGFFLNGRSYPLRGVSRHQDRAGVGNALTASMQEEDMAFIREIGANTVRLAHYQQAQEFYDLCDECGIIVWAEIPYITQHMPGGRENTLSQMRELVTQCYNHPSIVCWGLSNEITASGEGMVSPDARKDLLENHRLLNDLCHRLDATRPTVMAHVFMLETENPLIEIADMGSYNLYFGWYLGELEQNDSFFDEYHKKFPDRIIGFSEYGADANPQYHSARPEKGDYSEEYQCMYHEHLLNCIEKRPYLWATHVWNLFDFAADGRDEGGKHGVNQKGLVTMDRKLRKDAFYLYKAHWSKEAFVHICGRRYKNRAEDITEVRVYSNQGEVSLYVDGELLEKKEGNKVFLFRVPVTGEHRVEAKAGEQSDRIEIQRVKKEDPAYRMLERKEVVNWFNQDALDETCFSIRDTMGEIMANPAGAAILGRIMQKASASRGDVAQAANQNANLQKMMAGMPLESLLKQAGKAVSGEDIRNLNAALQKVKK